MKHRFLVPAALAAAALSLAACTPDAIVNPSDATSSPIPVATSFPSASPSHSAQPGVEPNAALAEMSWIDNGEGVEPGLTFTSPVNFTEAGGRMVADGSGAALKEGQAMRLAVVQFSGDDGSVLTSTYTSGESAPATLDSNTFNPILLDLLTKAHVGAHLLYAVPDTGNGASVVAFVVESAVDVLDKAQGTAVAPVAGLPKVTLGADGKPSVTYDGATKSTTLVAQDLIKGTGPVVKEGQSLTVNYTGWLYDGAQFDSSWDRGTPTTFTLATGQLIDGWVQGLAGKTVGSEVLLVVPADLAYGATGNGEAIPANSTLVFVVDILAAN